jgi:tetratricopeptide (TPR) repeat protein
VLEPARDQDDDTYQFAHALLVDAVLKSVSPARRRITHERIANIFAVRTPDAIDRIAGHYAKSSNRAEAYLWCRRAAASAMALYALDEAAEFLQHALSNASTDDERAIVLDQLAQAAEHAGRWADVERSCDAILATPGYAGETAMALPIQLRRLQARVRLGQGAKDTEAECLALLATAERVGTTADVVQTRSLLVQTLARVGTMDDAIRIAEESLKIAEDSGDDALACGAMHRLSITLLPSRTEDAVALLRRLIDRARGRDDVLGADALRSALSIAQESQALDVAASASMNLGVIGMRSGDFIAAHDALSDALRLYTTLRNNANRLAALYNLANLQQERGDAEAALALYRETTALADQLGTEDIAIGAHAGAGLASLRLRDIPAAELALEHAMRRLGSRHDWWFQKRELLESLAVRLDARAERYDQARARFHTAVPRLEESDGYAAAWMVADCAAELGPHDRTVWSQVERFARNPMVHQFVPLSARFTALVDMAERLDTAYLRTGDAR